MATSAPIDYRFDCEGLTQTELEAIFRATDLGGRQDGRILKAFRQSTDVCVARIATRLIGVSRLISSSRLSQSFARH